MCIFIWVEKSSSIVPITQPPPPSVLSRSSQPEDRVKARRPELDEETTQWCREQRCEENEDKKGRRYKVLKPLFIFLSPNINGKFPLKQSLLSWVEKPAKSTWQTETGKMESERWRGSEGCRPAIKCLIVRGRGKDPWAWEPAWVGHFNEKTAWRICGNDHKMLSL